MAIRHALLLMAGTAVWGAGPTVSQAAIIHQEAPDDEPDEPSEEDADADSPLVDSEDQADANSEDEKADTAAEIYQPPATPSPEVIILWADPPEDEFETEAAQVDNVRYIERCTNRRYCEETRKIVLADLAELLIDYIASSRRDRREDTPLLAETPGLANYTVSTGQKLGLEAGKPGPNDAEIWGQVARLVPLAQSDRLIGKFQVFSKPKSNTIAFIDRDSGTDRFVLGINDPVHLATDMQEQKLTIAHELMHMIVVSEAVPLAANGAPLNACDGIIEPDEGCYKRGTVYADFVKRFWSDADRAAAAKNDDFYNTKKGSFATVYAATNPHEDIAESFSIWMVDEGKGSSVADAKRRFFGSYPNLVALRQHIRQNMIGRILKERRRVAPRNTKPRT